MKKILIISPDNRHFVKQYIQNVFLNSDVQITFLTIKKNDEEASFFEKRNVRYIGIKQNNTKSIIYNLPGIIHIFFWMFLNINYFDDIHFHYIDERFLKVCKLFSFGKSKLIFSFWGGDLLRNIRKKSSIKYLKKWLNHVQEVTVMDHHSKIVFNELFGGDFENKLRVLDFGNAMIDLIDAEDNLIGKEEAKQIFGLPKGKTVVHIGYNGRIEQQHLQLIDALNGLDSKQKEKMFIVLHYGYGIGGEEISEREYIECTKKLIERVGIDYKIIFDYMSGEKLAAFRLTCDIFLYGQLTDAVSASVIESIYAGALFINPNWLDYSYFREKGVLFVEYNSFDEIPQIISEYLIKGALSDNEIIRNRTAIRSIKSWEQLAPRWLSLYQ